MKSTLILACLLTFTSLSAQFGYGLTFTNDLYHRYTNDGDDNEYKSAGSAILNIGLGPKIWVGGQNVSLSAEASANIGFLGLAVKDYKGLGTAAFPMLVNLNFKGLSGFDKEARTGFSIGGGIQYSRTELYGLRDKFKARGVERKLFKTYIIHVGYGFGLQGFNLQGFGRYGFNPDNDSQILTFGLQYDFNISKLNRIRDKASEL